MGTTPKICAKEGKSTKIAALRENTIISEKEGTKGENKGKIGLN